jgi:hypothetical protein
MSNVQIFWDLDIENFLGQLGELEIRHSKFISFLNFLEESEAIARILGYGIIFTRDKN